MPRITPTSSFKRASRVDANRALVVIEQGVFQMSQPVIQNLPAPPKLMPRMRILVDRPAHGRCRA